MTIAIVGANGVTGKPTVVRRHPRILGSGS
jgi:hypothetical protein